MVYSILISEGIFNLFCSGLQELTLQVADALPVCPCLHDNTIRPSCQTMIRRCFIVDIILHIKMPVGILDMPLGSISSGICIFLFFCT